MSSFIFEAEITPGMGTADFCRLAKEVEVAGFDRLGVSDVVLWPDAYQLQVLAAQATERIMIGSMVTNPYTRHPSVHAASLATLNDVSNGRAFCGIGVGAGLEEVGITPEKPVLKLKFPPPLDRDLKSNTSLFPCSPLFGQPDSKTLTSKLLHKVL